MELFDLVAMGGTFDAIHSGHMALLNKAFSISSKVIIGLTSDQLSTKKGKNLVNDYSKRFSLLKSVIEKNFPNSSYEISKLENDLSSNAMCPL